MVSSLWEKIIDPNRTFIIAEAGVNHNGDMKMAKKLIDAAVVTGADAVKFQTFKTEHMTSSEAPKAKYQKAATEHTESQVDMLRRLELSEADHRELYDYCQKKGITFLSTAFDEHSADFLDELGVQIFKTPSGELTNLPLLNHIARKGKPMIISTGMADLEEIRKAVQVIKETNNEHFALLHCVSSYPTDPEDANLKAIRTLEETFYVPVGFSDHTLGTQIAVYAVCMGASIIEKHITLDNALEGPDHQFSLTPDELKLLVTLIRNAEKSFGDGDVGCADSEADTAEVARKSIVAACDIKAGTVLSEELLTVKRPGTGLSPVKKNSVLGRKTKIDIPKDKLISLEMLG